MSPDDPRHGTYAGAAAHEREGTDPCGPCADARRAYQRRRPHLVALGHDLVVPVGEEAYAVLVELVDHGLTGRELTEITGLSDRNLRRILDGGAEARVRRRCRDALLAVEPDDAAGRVLTHLGCIRRTQALAKIGYSACHLADRTGLSRTTVKRVQLGEAAYTNVNTRVRIAAAYDELHMQPLERTKVTVRTFNLAERNQWAAPLAWDEHNIDDPAAAPASPRVPRGDRDIDDSVILRLLAGDTVPASPAERVIALRRWIAGGRSEAEFCQLHGWRPGRYAA